MLEERLKQLEAKPSFERRVAASERRYYPPVFPKFRNPDDPSETWAGRGKQPRWLAEQLRSGKKLDDLKSRWMRNRIRRHSRFPTNKKTARERSLLIILFEG